MQLSETTLKWIMRFYPPLLFQRIWVHKFAKDFTGVEVKIFKSFLNTNYNKSIFGGTIFSASDPFYPLLFDQVLRKRGYKTRVWLKSADIKYLKPGRSALSFKIVLTENDILEAENILKSAGKYVKFFPVDIYNDKGEICATANNEVYIRNLYYGEDGNIAY